VTWSQRTRSRASASPRAFTDAASSLRAARDLLRDYAKNHQPRSLLALSDFADRVRPRLSALRPDVPASALPAYTALVQLLDLVDTSTRRLLATCGAPCGPASPGRSDPGATHGVPGASLPAGGTGGASVGVSLGSSSSASLTVPLSPLTTLLPSDPVTSATTLLPSAPLSLGDQQ
jgi:hypothetical protein